MQKLLWVGTGGFMGAIFRYLLTVGTASLSFRWGFPAGTAIANMLGCLLIGLLNVLADSRDIFSPELRLMVFVGMLGAFTTFSTFSYESLVLWREHESAKALLNIGGQVALGLGMVWLGLMLGQWLVAR